MSVSHGAHTHSALPHCSESSYLEPVRSQKRQPTGLHNANQRCTTTKSGTLGISAGIKKETSDAPLNPVRLGVYRHVHHTDCHTDHHDLRRAEARTAPSHLRCADRIPATPRRT